MSTTDKAKKLWDTLSPIDCSKNVEKKGSGNFVATYLSWTWAWSTLMDNFPNAHYEFCLLYTSPSPRDGLLSRMPSSA